MARWSTLLVIAASVLTTCGGDLVHTAAAETLRDVLDSQAFKRVKSDTSTVRMRNRTSAKDDDSYLAGIDPQSEYARIWSSERGGQQLLNWLSVELVSFKATEQTYMRNRERVYASTTLKNRDGHSVKLEVLIPHPTYHTMVNYRTLSEFNKFEPPALETVAQEELSFSKVKGMYYRTPKGECSVLIKLEKFGIVNLSVMYCEESNLMTQVIDSLNFERLNQKLNS